MYIEIYPVLEKSNSRIILITTAVSGVLTLYAYLLLFSNNYWKFVLTATEAPSDEVNYCSSPIPAAY